MPWLIVLLGYFLGSIPTAYIASRLLRDKDIRQMGDGNMGAANAFRQLGAKVGIAVFFVDASKGALAILIAQAANIPQLAVLLTGAAAVIGHNWSVFIGFRGGRGESTTIGVLATLVTLPMLIVGGVAGVAFLVNRRVILGQGPFLFPPLPLVCWGLGVPGVLVAYGIALPCLVGITHFARTRRTVRYAKRRPPLTERRERRLNCPVKGLKIDSVPSGRDCGAGPWGRMGAKRAVTPTAFS